MPQGLSQAVLLSTTLTLSLLLPQELWPSASLHHPCSPRRALENAQPWHSSGTQQGLKKTSSLRACEGQEWENRAQDSRGAAQTAPGIGQWAAPVAPLGSRAVADPSPAGRVSSGCQRSPGRAAKTPARCQSAPGPAAQDKSPAPCRATAAQCSAEGGLSLSSGLGLAHTGTSSETLFPNTFLQASSHPLSSSWKAVSDLSLLLRLAMA